MSAGLTISTLHSHHHLDLHHPPEIADTGSCISADTTICPICAVFKVDIPATLTSGETTFYVDQLIVEDNYIIARFPVAVNRGRSPPPFA